MARYTLCPFYIDESEKAHTISCEDVIRMWDSAEEKCAYMDTYCDASWMECPYAKAMTDAYEAEEKGDDKAVEKNKMAALEKEIRGLYIKLGRYKKKIDELRAVNQSFVNTNESLEKQKKEFYKRWRTAQAELEKDKSDINQELAKLGIIYEQRMAYLIENFAPNKVLLEEDVKTWAGEKEFALVPDYTEHEQLAWKVVYKTDECKSDHVPDEVQKTE